MIGVYGANGFIGRHLMRRLVAANMPVRGVSRRFDVTFIEEFGETAELTQIDIRQPLDTTPTLNGIDTIVQLVSTSTPALKNELSVADIEENVIPHVAFLQSCVHAGVKRYVFISSGGSIYGPGAPVPTPETAPTNPVSSHGLTKLAVEKYIQMHGAVDGLEYVILRLANPFGPGQEFRKGQGLIPAILDQYRKRLPVQIFGDGSARRDFVFIDDVIDAVLSALRLTGSPRAIINVGGGETRSVPEVIATIEAVTGHSFERHSVPARKTDVDVSSLDITRALDVLGWTPKTSFRDGIERTVGQLSR